MFTKIREYLSSLRIQWLVALYSIFSSAGRNRLSDWLYYRVYRARVMRDIRGYIRAAKHGDACIGVGERDGEMYMFSNVGRKMTAEHLQLLRNRLTRRGWTSQVRDENGPELCLLLQQEQR